MKIGIAQMDILWNQPEENIKKARAFAESALKEGVQLLLYPETFVTGFSFLAGQEASRAGSLATEFLQKTASEFSLYVGGSLHQMDQKDKEHSKLPRNTFCLFGPSGHVGDYSKCFLMNLLGEGKHFLPGENLRTFSIEGLRISPRICYDLRFSQAFSSAAQETDVFVVVANWPESRQLHWENLLVARAIENQAYVIGVNRVGLWGKFRSIGGSLVVSPRGDILDEASKEEELLVCEIFSEEVQKARTEFPFLEDRDKHRVNFS